MNIATIAISPHTDDMSNLIVRIIKSDSKHSFIPGFFLSESIIKIYMNLLERILSNMKMAIFLIVNRVLLQQHAIIHMEIGCFYPNILHNFKSNKKPQ